MPRLRSWTSLAFLLCLAACATARQVGKEPVYRYINVTDGDVIRLGEPFTRTDLAVRLNRREYTLEPGTFYGGGTSTIRLTLAENGRVGQMTFVYDGSEPLDAKVRKYTESLGPPSEATQGEGGAKRYVWQDAQTRFELFFDPTLIPSFWSRLTDLTSPK